MPFPLQLKVASLLGYIVAAAALVVALADTTGHVLAAAGPFG
jgi:hypothetical protein